ncbi:MAG: PLP-dependent transferase, partial [Pseudomonadota bacterium]
IEAISKVAKDAGVPLVVDNTLATPYLVRPKEHGADIVLHSLTKFIGGHGNSVGGMIVDCGTFDWAASGDKYPDMTQPNGSYHGMKIAETFGPMGIPFAIACRVLGLRDLGACIAPMNSFLILTGCETLPLRMDKHSANALAVAQYLENHPAVDWVRYASLPSAGRQYELAQKYCPKGAGACFTFGLKGGYDVGKGLVANVKLFSHLANLGDLRSLIIHPASTTHSQLTEQERSAAGAGPEVVRVSIGIEDADDIIADLDQALDSATSAASRVAAE